MNVAKKFTTFIICVGVCVGLYFAYSTVGGSGFDDSISYIKRHFSGRGILQDTQDEIGIKSIDDVRWYDVGKKIEIEYGKVKLKVKKTDLLENKNQVVDKLKQVYVEVKYNKDTDTYRFFYRGEEMDKYRK